MDDIVWLHDLRKYAYLKHRHAHYSVVYYHENGHIFEIEVENDDYDTWEERAIEYDTE